MIIHPVQKVIHFFKWMDNQFDDLLYSRMPGSSLGREPRIQNKYLLLVYRGVHIPAKEYESWIKNEVIVKLFNKTLVQLIISHKKVDVDNKIRKYTYVIVRISEAIKTRNHKIFNWKGEQPEIRMLSNIAQVNEAISYIENWRHNLPKTEESVPILVPLSLPVLKRVESLQDQIKKIVLLQQRVLTAINEQCDVDKCLEDRSRPIHTIYHTNAHYDLLYLLKNCETDHHNPNRFLISTVIPNRASLDKEMKEGWTGECLVLDITRQDIIGDIHRTLDEAVDRCRCPSVWIFAKKIPCTNIMTICRQKFYQIGQLPDRTSELRLLPYLEVVNIFYEQYKLEQQ